MDWDNLRFVLAISREGNLSRAAAALGVTHTTVGRRLKSSEEQLGVRLFDRTPEGFVLTPAGEDLVGTAEHVEANVLSAQSRLMGRDAELRGSLIVSSLDFLYPLIHDALLVFLERYPRVDVTMTVPMDPVSLTRREADVALRMSNSPPEGLVGQRVGKLTFAAYASPALVSRIGADGPLAHYPCISLDKRLGQQWLDTWFRKNAPGARIVARVDENTMLVRAMVAGGIGAFFMPTFEGKARGLVQLGPVLEQYTTDLWLLTLPELKHTSRVRVFMDHIAAALRAQDLAPQDLGPQK
jgi:DNA-binding transcriptional LysR family regulator